jgi:hypothetical protein
VTAGSSGSNFRFAYTRARGLASFGSGRSAVSPGLDLDLEWGYGRGLPLDRWWSLGGSSFMIGSRTQGVLAPNFLVGRLGLPLRFAGPVGTSLQVIPRIDYGMLAEDPGALFGPYRGMGAGVVMRTILTKFYVQFAYGFLRGRDPDQGWGRTSGSFNLLIGTQPFDFWNQR